MQQHTACVLASRRLVRGVAVIASALLHLVPLAVEAQWRTPRLPEPQLVDTPWGDFPLERAMPGARLRLTPIDGPPVRVRLVAVRDSTLELSTGNGIALPPASFADLRALRMVEVRARPAWRDRAMTIGLIAGAVAGGAAGGLLHKDESHHTGDHHHASLGEDIAAYASLGAFVGWSISNYWIGRARWRPVTVP